MASSKANLGRPKGAKLEGLKQVASCRIKEMTGPKSKHKANKWLLPILAFCSMLGVVFSIGGITLAAYINTLKIENKVKVDFSDLGQYFDGQVVKNDDQSYDITLTTVEDIRTLQKIVSIGLLDENDVITLGNDITWSGDWLYPIGSEDMPFRSRFDGAGHTITNLSIVGYESSDVGLFGYTSVTSEVKNLILSGAHVSITTPDNDPALILSPLEGYFLNAAKSLPDITINGENAGTINIANPTGTGEKATITGFPSQITDSQNQSHPITWEADSDLLELVYSTDASGNRVLTQINCQANPESLAPEHDLYATTLEAKVGYSIDDNFGYYVLERYQINLLGSGKVSSAIHTDENGVETPMGAFKTIHPSQGDHGTNIGFFIGHCDGAASYLGLESSEGNKGVLSLDDGTKFSVYSSRVLIGKTRLDNPLDPTAGNELRVIYDYSGQEPTDWENGFTDEFGNVIDPIKVVDQQSGHENQEHAYGYGYSEEQVNRIYVDNEYHPTKIVDGEGIFDGWTNYHYEWDGDRPVDNDLNIQETNAETMSKSLLSPHQLSYSKFYPGTNQVTANGTADKWKPTTSNWELTNGELTSYTAQTLNGGLGATTMTKIRERVHEGWIRDSYFYYRLVRGITANNGYVVWSTKETSPFFSENEFYINFSFTYVAEQDEPYVPGSEDNNNFQILFNLYNPDVTELYYYDLIYSDVWSPSHARFLFWQDASKVYDINNSLLAEQPFENFDPNDYPVKADGQEHEVNIQLAIDVDNNDFWGDLGDAILDWIRGDEETSQNNVRLPIFAVGYGKNGMHYYADAYENYQNGSWNETQSRFIDGGSNVYNGSDLNSYLFDASKIDPGSLFGISSFPTPEQYQAFSRNGTQDGSDVTSNLYNNHERAYFNSYFKVGNGVKVLIKDFEATFTNREGNTASLVNNVDYVNGGYTYSQEGVWTAWPDSTNVLISLNWDKNTHGVADFSFYRQDEYFAGLYITAAANGVLSNTAGYSEAYLGEGQ